MKQQTSEPPPLGGGQFADPHRPQEPIEPTQPPLPGLETFVPQPPDVTQLQTENAELRAAVRLADARASLTTELGKSGARSPELLFEAVKQDVQFDAEGRPINVAGLVDRLRRQYPEQFGMQFASSIDAGAGQTPGPRLTREALARMKPSEIAELDWADVRRVLSNS